jgi:hypothetical protein
MTPQEKAKELVNWFDNYKPIKLSDYSRIYTPTAKQFALKVCHEIMEFMRIDDEYTETASNANSKWVDYYIEVEKEIEKL